MCTFSLGCARAAEPRARRLSLWPTRGRPGRGRAPGIAETGRRLGHTGQDDAAVQQRPPVRAGFTSRDARVWLCFWLLVACACRSTHAKSFRAYAVMTPL